MKTKTIDEFCGVPKGTFAATVAAEKRAEQIRRGKLWAVYPDGSSNHLFEGTKTACNTYIKTNKLARKVKRGEIRLGQIIWENGPKEYNDLTKFI